MTLILAASLLAAQVAAPQIIETSPVPLDQTQQIALRCSVAFALASRQQQDGTVADESWPELAERGREYFVRSMARIMDETGATRTGLGEYLRPESEALQQPGRLEEIMPSCLLMLDASGL
ncbi:hypothetical protein [Qipengyuania zhejiangensis]|uniref:hypothetical protein n=1 Tax=Qipengyuania zhejiangensis TaxID=3077782 RepID=UPI002D793CF2|nr:hypothetical protein [Qipengyuania sp. Z2]